MQGWRPAGNLEAEIEVSANDNAPLGPRSLFVEKPDGLAALSGGVVVTLPIPEISSIVPNSGIRSGGTPVTIYGSNFHQEASVSLSGIPLRDLTWLDSGTVQGTTEPNGCGALNLLVVNPDGSSARLQSAFETISPAPTIESVSPGSAEVTSLVTISGRNFDPVAEYNRVRFNNHPAEVISATESRIVTLVPFGADQRSDYRGGLRQDCRQQRVHGAALAAQPEPPPAEFFLPGSEPGLRKPPGWSSGWTRRTEPPTTPSPELPCLSSSPCSPGRFRKGVRPTFPPTAGSR